jgi:hypothetical protein
MQMEPNEPRARLNDASTPDPRAVEAVSVGARDGDHLVISIGEVMQGSWPLPRGRPALRIHQHRHLPEGEPGTYPAACFGIQVSPSEVLKFR